MTQTIERDLTPAEVGRELKRLLAKVNGRHPFASLMITAAGTCEVSVTGNLCGPVDDAIRGRGETFREMLADCERNLAASAGQRRETLIRRMALAIIDIADEHVTVTAHLLRAKGFRDDEIKATHEAACTRASEMCGNAPFVVEGV